MTVTLKDPKILKNAPCLFLTWDDAKNGWKKIAPAVDCSFWCDCCGWNQNEMKRRFKEGEWVTDERTGRRSLVFKSALRVEDDAVL